MGPLSGFPILEPPPNPHSGKPVGASRRDPGSADAHVRSTQAVNGFHLQASDGRIGHAGDYMIEAHTWAIRQLVVKFGHRFSGS